jgi:hypothetical protein
MNITIITLALQLATCRNRSLEQMAGNLNCLAELECRFNYKIILFAHYFKFNSKVIEQI